MKTASIGNSVQESFANLRGTVHARAAVMEPARRIEDLVAWQLACQLRDLIDRMVLGERVCRDFPFKNQIKDSSASVPSNLAEGFGRFYPKANAHHVRIAKASLTETQNHLKHGKKQNYWRANDYETAWRLSCRIMKATTSYLVYLEGCENEVPERRSPEAKDESDKGENATDDPNPEEPRT